VSFPFPTVSNLLGKLTSAVLEELRAWLPSEHPLGIYITPHAVSVTSGKLSISKSASDTATEMTIRPELTHGEAERSMFRNFKEPTLLYGYICAVRPEAKSARVQIHSRTLRHEKENWAKDRLDAFVGAVLARTASADIVMEPGGLTVHPIRSKPGEAAYDRLFRRIGPPVLEVKNDQYPTSVFQRRIITVRDPSGAECLALEENMERMRLEPIDCDREVTVASIGDEDKCAALDKVLEETGFFSCLQQRCTDLGKDPGDLSIAIKPNFMFAYNKDDHTTYTDPELVKHLAARLHDGGFTNLRVVEAHSTYGEYFDKRSVREMADYLDFTSDKFKVVDLTEEAEGEHDLGPALKDTPFSPTWRDADFRISFAKNKTHSYAYYTLTLKNIYGALPLGDKFKEYHVTREIYKTTIAYLDRFPVDFGLVDAHLSADGPFGIFADTAPNPTHTIIGGPDLVAVDWVASTKMGIDPMLSEYMQRAVEQFGKPRIKLVGDGSPYRPWLNVPTPLTLFTHNLLDANYHFGNVFYMVCAQMDERRFELQNKRLWLRLMRALTRPFRTAVFLSTGENPSWLNRLLNAIFYKLGY
jgi:uncharacterized protein (DUF362 family)